MEGGNLMTKEIKEQTREEGQSFKLEGKYKDFYEFHGVQLYGAGFPIQLVPQLVDKLEGEVNDFAEYFSVEDNQEEENFQASALKELKKGQNVFLIDHQLTYKMEGLRNVLESNEDLVKKLRYQLQYFDGLKSGEEGTQESSNKGIVEIEDQGIVDPLELTIDEGTVSLSLFDNQISDINKVKDLLTKLPSLKVIFLNYNPVSEGESGIELQKMIEEQFKNIEMLNSKFTANCGEFGLKFANYKYNVEKANLMRSDAIKQLDLQKKGILNISDFSVFEKFKNIKSIDLRNTTIESEEEIQKLISLIKNCKGLVNLKVDWTTELKLWKIQISSGELTKACPTLESLNERQFSYGEPKPNEPEIRFICQNIWKIAGNYRLVSETQMDETSYWYLNDLPGIAIQHSDKPNTKLIPFLYAPHFKLEDAKAYSVMWADTDIAENQLLTRDYLSGFTEESHRASRLAGWFKVSEAKYTKINMEYQKKLQQQTVLGKHFLHNFVSKPAKFIGLNDSLPHKRPLNVITDNQLVTEFLTASEFHLCKTLEEADVIFLTHCFEETIRDHYLQKFCNQFPEECRIVQKHHLADTVLSVLGQVDWLQPTFNLKTQMDEFVAEYKRREKTYENNVWIVKAFNLARSVDMIVTDNLTQIIRQTEPLPRIAQKYITNPVTIYNKKIDLRYIIAVRSLEPLDVFLYKVFWIRTSNNDFSNDYRSRDVYETHFTVMNYGKKLHQIHFDEFIQQFEKENPEIKWSTVHEKIKQLVRELFTAVTEKYPGMAHPNCRGVYGMDVMVEAGVFQPKLLELTFSPDCERACKYHPQFYNDMFQLLFLNDKEHPNYEALFQNKQLF